MPSSTITYFCEDIFFTLPSSQYISEWISYVIHSEKKILSEINFIFTSDKYLLDINISHLNHNYYTDVISFDYSNTSNLIEGDIFISIERVKENAILMNVTFLKELYRVMIHGILHLIGYKDKSDSEVAIIRQKEDYYLSTINF